MMNNQPAAAENGRDGEIFLSIVVGEQHQGAQVRQRGSSQKSLENPTLNDYSAGCLHCHQLGVSEANLQPVSSHQDSM